MSEKSPIIYDALGNEIKSAAKVKEEKVVDDMIELAKKAGGRLTTMEDGSQYYTMPNGQRKKVRESDKKVKRALRKLKKKQKQNE